MTGVSFVVPVLNGEPWLEACLAGLRRQADGRPFEILVVEDGSTDRSAAILERAAREGALRIIRGPRRGAAAAVNAGIAAATYPLIAQVDQDVVLEPGWMVALAAEFAAGNVAAAQGCYVHQSTQPLVARVMALDLEQRYGRLTTGETDQVCTGNTIYRADALRDVGCLDDTLGYGYDNDLSYRLRAAGYRLRFSSRARSVHYWRAGVMDYWRQQYGFGYGRLDVIVRHRARWRGDRVSPFGMMLHAPVTLAALVLGVIGSASAVGHQTILALWTGAALLSVLAAERLAAGARTATRFRNWTPLCFPVLHLIRDTAWSAAIVTWTVRRLAARRSHPAHSMRPRPGGGRRRPPETQPPGPEATLPEAALLNDEAVLAVVPAHNEAGSLPHVVADIRHTCPGIAILVVDDGSVDGTAAVAASLGVRWLRLSERLGVGSAMRAGIRYAARRGFRAVVRLDGDGQHAASDVPAMLNPIRQGLADVVLGSRFTESAATPKRQGWLRHLLGVCLSRIIGRRVTDPTSGFWALGPRAMALLADDHPTGYPEPELLLLLDRRRLTTVEVPVRSQARAAGRTSLTAMRVAMAGTRVLLAMVIVPLRQDAGRTPR
jgi:glycosyltransferase involved in cell wall biosynthesis